MYLDRTQNYDPEIHEEYLIQDIPFPLPHPSYHLHICSHVQTHVAIQTN